MLEWSTGTIDNTTPITVPLETGIWQISTGSYAELTINGGEIQFVDVYQESTVSFHGGQILGNLTVADTTAWVHIFGYGFNNDPFPGSPLTGFWADDTAFSINLVDSTISTYDQIIFHEIPEPATLILFGLGGIFLRRKCRAK